MAGRAKNKKSVSKPRNPGEKISGFHQKMTIAFLIVSSLLILLIFYFTIAEVKIQIRPLSSELNSTFTVELLPDVTTTLAGTNIVPAIIETGIEERSETISIEGGTEVSAVATGEVTIINNYSRAQPLIKTTRLLTTDGKLFRIDKTINVPAGGQVTTRAYADEIGPEFEIAPTRFTIPGLWEGLQEDIYAESIAPFTGGTRLEKSVTDEFINQSGQDLANRVKESLERTTYPQEGFVQITIVGNDITWNSETLAGDIVDNLTISVKIPVTTITFAIADLESVSINNLVTQTPAYQQFLSADLTSLNYRLQAVDTNDKSAALEVSLKGKSASRLQKTDLDITELKGKTYQELISHLENIPGIADVSVSFTPSWLKKVPSLQDHVYIEIVD